MDEQQPDRVARWKEVTARYNQEWRKRRLVTGGKPSEDGRRIVGGKPSTDHRALWTAALEVLRTYERLTSADREALGHEAAEFPIKLVTDFSLAVEELLAGSMPETFDRLLERGAPSIRPFERQARYYAQQYTAGARAGLINDRHWVKTLYEQFGVDRSTMTKWLREPVTGAVFETPRRSDALHYRSVEAALNYVAEQYRERGRSHRSIANRGSEWG